MDCISAEQRGELDSDLKAKMENSESPLQFTFNSNKLEQSMKNYVENSIENEQEINTEKIIKNLVRETITQENLSQLLVDVKQEALVEVGKISACGAATIENVNNAAIIAQKVMKQGMASDIVNVIKTFTSDTVETQKSSAQDAKSSVTTAAEVKTESVFRYLLIAVVVLAVIGAIGGGVYLFIRHKQQQQAQELLLNALKK